MVVMDEGRERAPRVEYKESRKREREWRRGEAKSKGAKKRREKKSVEWIDEGKEARKGSIHVGAMRRCVWLAQHHHSLYGPHIRAVDKERKAELFMCVCVVYVK